MIFLPEGSATKAAINILVSLLSTRFYGAAEPFINRRDQRLAMAAQCAISLTLASGLMLKTQVVSDNGGLGAPLIAVNAMVILVAVGNVCLQSRYGLALPFLAPAFFAQVVVQSHLKNPAS